MQSQFKNKIGENESPESMKNMIDSTLVFNNHTRVTLIDDDPDIPSLKHYADISSEFAHVEFLALPAIAETAANTYSNIIGVIHKIGEIETVPLKSGATKLRRKVLVVDDSNLSCIICFWADKHLKMLDNNKGSILLVMNVRVSDYFHKSLNANEDSKVYTNPEGIAKRSKQLDSWYTGLRPGDHYKFSPLSGSLDVEGSEKRPEAETAAAEKAKTEDPGDDRTNFNENPEDKFACGFEDPKEK